jgi:hypothetical protein
MIRGRPALVQPSGGDKSLPLAPILWAGSGFLAGAAFWHLVGFWSLISLAVLGINEPSAAKQTPIAERPVTRPIETGTIRSRPAPASCVSLALNRTLGETRSMPCQTGTFHHLNRGLGTKADRAISLSSWSTTLE